MLKKVASAFFLGKCTQETITFIACLKTRVLL